jgi:hypothetical protein
MISGNGVGVIRDGRPAFPQRPAGHRAGRDEGRRRIEENPTMTEPGRTPHSTESAEGDLPGDDETGGRTPHPEEPAEGGDVGGDNADTPDA